MTWTWERTKAVGVLVAWLALFPWTVFCWWYMCVWQDVVLDERCRK
jgi:hypothetical protein